MKNALKFVMVLTVTILLMLAFRALVFTVYTVRGTALEPCLIEGDRVLVDRWSYGLRTGGSKLFRYVRWAASPVERGDLVVFNNPADASARIAGREVLAYFCTGVPGDTVKAIGTSVVVPGKGVPCRVTAENIGLICMLYNRHEGKKAEIIGGNLIVDGKPTRCATFNNDYYCFSSGNGGYAQGSCSFGLVPETHVIGKVRMLLYSADSRRPVYDCLRPNRWLLMIEK